MSTKFEKELQEMRKDLLEKMQMHSIAIQDREKDRKETAEKLAQVDVCLKALEFDRRGSVKIVAGD